MDVMLGFLSQYLSAVELVGKEVTLEIAKVTLEKVESLKSDEEVTPKMKDRIVLYFKGAKDGRGLLLNRTNAMCLIEMYGRETNNWLGKRVTLHTQQVRVGPKVEPGIRVKGSPDLKAPHTFQLKLPRRRPIPYTLLPTAKDAPHQEPQEQVDTDTGEITPPAADWVEPYLDRIADATGTDSLKTEYEAAQKEAKTRGDKKALERIVKAKDAAKQILATPVKPAPHSDAIQAIAGMEDDLPFQAAK